MSEKTNKGLLAAKEALLAKVWRDDGSMGDVAALIERVAYEAAQPAAITATNDHEHQFPEVDQDGTLVAFPCLLCGLSAGDALKLAAEERQMSDRRV